MKFIWYVFTFLFTAVTLCGILVYIEIKYRRPIPNWIPALLGIIILFLFTYFYNK